MTAAEAADFFTEPKLRQILHALNEVGLDYVGLGQPLSTLSGGEGKRLKLAADLHRVGSVYLMDEPTTGLHMSDTHRLLGIVDQGNTVIVIELNLDIVKSVDWIIDLPDAGSPGGSPLTRGGVVDSAVGREMAVVLIRHVIGVPLEPKQQYS
ncbi:ATP-binding cassette domain-containing protein [Streptomyces sp. NPDC054962]